MHLERGIVKDNCPWGVSFEQEVQISTYAREGEVGLNIVRCIISVEIYCSPYMMKEKNTDIVHE